MTAPAHLPPRPARSVSAVAGLVVLALLLVGAGVSAVWSRRAEHQALTVTEFPVRASLVGPLHAIGVGEVGTLVAREPVTLLGVRPYAVSPGTTVGAARALFNGFAPSPSGHRQTRGGVSSACAAGPWPPVGFGPTYPVEGLTLARGDVVGIAFYAHGPGRPGTYTVTGFEVTYRDAHGAVRVLSGHGARLDLVLRPGAERSCERRGEGIAGRIPGFPA